MSLADEPQVLPVTEREIIHRGPVAQLVQESFTYGASTLRREFIVHPGAVAVVALNGEEEVALIRQYRHPVRARLWEIPAGLLDVAGEDYQAAAARELAEEADLAAEQWRVLVDSFTSPGGSDESIRIFLARGLSEVPAFARFDEEADMELRWVPLEEAVTLILDGSIHNPATIAGILATAAAQARGWDGLRSPEAPWLRARP